MKKKFIGFLILVCMLAPSVSGYIPSAMFPVVSSAASTTFAQQKSTGTPLPPGTITNTNTWKGKPNIVQTASFSSQFAFSQYNTSGDYIYNSSAGIYIFPKSQPWLAQFNSTQDLQSVSFSTFGVNQSSF
ncbi:MAG: hypothetical protein M1368_12660, partial [Thaumarchaeota archaeon]|nr:hypothetical protein [Nitrososphaerota archaeon]